MLEFERADAIRTWSREQRDAGRRVGLVPTMGYLHQGHLHLVDALHSATDALAVSIFVNPTQFGPDEDLDRYPRDDVHDRDVLANRNIGCVFRPSVSEMYGAPPVITVDPGELGRRLCGRTRPGHFRGVLTVVAKLFHLVEPDVAMFGRKDLQQVTLIEAMTRDLDFPVAIETAPIVREYDGLAMSSRNVYLSRKQRTAAPALARALDAAHASFHEGERGVQKLYDAARVVLDSESSIEIEYLQIVDPSQLDEVVVAGRDSIMAVAVHLGRTRLIDNVPLVTGTSLDPRVDR